jgi:hypothetical protein
MIIKNLDDIGFLREVWPFLTSEDIVHLLMSCKEMNKISNEINHVVSAVINLGNLKRTRHFVEV